MNTTLRTFCIVASFLSAGSLLAQGKTVADKQGLVTLSAPEGLQFGKSNPLEVGEEPKDYPAIEFQLSAPGARQFMVVTARVINGGSFQLLPVLVGDRVYFDSYKDAEKAEVVGDPAPHVVVYIRGKGERLLVVMYRRLVGRSLKFMVRCDQKEWKAHKAALFGMLDGAQTKLAPWPTRATGDRKEKDKKGVVFSVADDVKDKKALREVESVVLDLQKGIEGVHGQIVRPKGEPLVVYINSLMADHKRIGFTERVAPAIHEGHGLFTVPLKERGDRDRAQFVHLTTDALLWEIYGGFVPLWLTVGERKVWEQLDLTKKKLPKVEKDFLETVKVNLKFEELASKKEIPADDYWAECFAYVSMFHAGPKDYRAAFQAFLADYKKTGDSDAALQKHLLSIDQNEMREDVLAWIKKLRGVKVK